MRQEDLKEMADRCRLKADTADDFIKRRLLYLKLKYQARSAGISLASKRLTSLAFAGSRGSMAESER